MHKNLQSSDYLFNSAVIVESNLIVIVRCWDM